jgi:MFS family permease
MDRTAEEKKLERKILIVVLLSAFAYGLQITGIVPVMGLLTEQYSNYSTDAIRFLQTVPYFLTIIGALLVGKFSNKFGEKKVLTVGLMSIGVIGVLPFFTSSYPVVFISRALSGFGFGIASPINTSIIARFIKPERRATYTGMTVVGMGLGTMVENMTGGILATISVQAFFLVYLVAVFAAVGVGIILPKTEPVAVELPEKKRSRESFNYGTMIWMLCMASFMHTLFINAYSTNISIYILENITSDTTVTGMVTALNAGFALLTGLIFGKILNFFKGLTLPVSILAAALGYAVIMFVPGLVGTYIGSALCGVSLSSFMACCSFLISISVSQDKVAGAGGMFSIFGSIGGFIAPFVLGRLAVILGGNTVANQFMGAMLGMVVLAIVMYFVIKNGPAPEPPEESAQG